MKAKLLRVRASMVIDYDYAFDDSDEFGQQQRKEFEDGMLTPVNLLIVVNYGFQRGSESDYHTHQTAESTGAGLLSNRSAPGYEDEIQEIRKMFAELLDGMIDELVTVGLSADEIRSSTNKAIERAIEEGPDSTFSDRRDLIYNMFDTRPRNG